MSSNKPTSLRRSILANYASQLYVMALGIFILPVYLRYMGAEAFGLVGFYSMLQMWFGLLDAGLTPTVARQTAVHCSGETSSREYRHVIRWLEYCFLSISILGAAIMFFAAPFIASKWLEGQELSVRETTLAIELIAFVVALRWLSGIYRGVITGFERQTWLAGFSAAIATSRFVGVLPIMAIFGGTPGLFFSYQLAVAAVEATCIVVTAYRLMPSTPRESLYLSLRLSASLRSAIKFSLTIALTSSAWVLITQLDKLVLSGILPLAQYGHFTLAVLGASAVGVISGPVSAVIMPRMARLNAERNEQALIAVYRQATQAVSILASSLAITLALKAESLLRTWTGNADLARDAAPILRLYAIGNGILAISAFPYYLQYAYGNLRLHLIGNGLFVVVLVPAIIWAAINFGGIGAGYVWVAMNCLAFGAWLPFVHRKFVPQLNRKWYLEDTSMIVAAAFLGAYVVDRLVSTDGEGIWKLVEAVLTGIAALVGAGLASSAVRGIIKNYVSEVMSRR